MGLTSVVFQDSAGSSLYILYKAIKVQVEKGPIDHLTNDARYSLSEDRLLRTEFKLEPETLVRLGNYLLFFKDIIIYFANVLSPFLH